MKRRKRSRRLWGLLLTAAMLCGLCPAIPARADADITFTKDAAPQTLNLAKEGKIDWVHLTATDSAESTSVLVTTRKPDIEEILQVRTLEGTTGTLVQGDHATKYSWSNGISDGGESYIAMKDKSLGAVFIYQKGSYTGEIPEGTEVGYEITVPAEANGATDLSFITGVYASKTEIAVYADGSDTPQETELLETTGAETYQYNVHFDAGTPVRVVVKTSEKKNGNGNVFVGGIYLSSQDAPAGDITVSSETASGSMNLSVEGNVDWMHLTGTTNKEDTSRQITTRKSESEQVIGFTTVGNTGTLIATDHAVAYSWTKGYSDGGEDYTERADENLSAVFSYKQGQYTGEVTEEVGYDIMVPEGTSAKELIFVAGGYASESAVSVYRKAETEEEEELIKTEAVVTGNGAVTNRYTVQFEEGTGIHVKVRMTKKNLPAGNLFIGGIALSTGELAEGPAFYEPNTMHWLYFGWENDYPKSLSTMGGALYAGKANGLWWKNRGLDPNPIRYTVTVGEQEFAPDETSENRRENTNWYQADGYMNSPVSEWNAGDTGIRIRIQHIANRVLEDQATVVFSKVTLTNQTEQTQTATLNVSQPSGSEVPLNGVTPTEEGKNYCLYTTEIPAGESISFDFAAKANGTADIKQLKELDGFDIQYAAVKAYYDGKLDGMAVPISLPDEEMVNSYKNSILVMIETMVKNGSDYEIRGAAGTQADLHGYDMTFPHDVPNMVEQFIRDGNLELAQRILGSNYYQNIIQDNGGNLDAVGKFILPYATMWQVMDDEARAGYYSEAIKNTIKSQAHQIPEYLDENGIMQLSESFDNSGVWMTNLVVDNFASLHGLCAYQYLCDAWGWTEESEWAGTEMDKLNTALNKAIDDFMEREGKTWYMCDLTGYSMFWKNYVNGRTIYDGNWLGTTFMMSTFPWDAVLRGYELGGTWAEYLDASIDNAMELKAQRGDIPEGSWGAWWGNDYGAVYNVGMTTPLLYSEKYRTMAIENYEWLLDNQCSPFQWGESFNKGQTDTDWCEPAFDYETWGLGFLRQGLLEATVSVTTDGDVIVGRGIPDQWLEAETPIEWKNISINDGRKLTDLKITRDGNVVHLEIQGDDAVGEIAFNLPIFKDNIASVSAGEIDRENGIVTLTGDTKSVDVTLGEFVEDPTDPTDPEDPADPTDPVDPTDPTDPTDPVDPTDPSDPADPGDPSDPTDPGDPSDPTDPTDPVNPVDPSDPTDPAAPVDPADPTDPTDPVNPVNPSDPTDLADPAAPAASTDPSDGNGGNHQGTNSGNHQGTASGQQNNIEKNQSGKENSKTVKTGDTVPIAGTMAAVGISVVVIAAILANRRKKR